jgi:hypothetical protein
MLLRLAVHATDMRSNDVQLPVYSVKVYDVVKKP